MSVFGAYEVRLALAAAAVPIGLLALASGFTPAGRRHPIAVGAGTLALYIFTVFRAYGYAEHAIRAAAIPAGSFAWMPNAAIVFIAGVVYACWSARTQTSRS